MNILRRLGRPSITTLKRSSRASCFCIGLARKNRPSPRLLRLGSQMREVRSRQRLGHFPRGPPQFAKCGKASLKSL
jgi:hypothetical protein